jgi:DNA-binding transcriptional LysR family regulator
MEMHQVRYFLAVTRTLNFTRAADECNVTQPSLTRAIKQLEGELGGDLFRRERPAAQLTELGQRMLPLLKQCYDAALGARTLASSFRTGDIGALRLALSHTLDIAILIPFLEELKRSFKGLEFKLMRGSAEQIAEYLKKGDAELAIAAGIDEEWDRLDSWPLFTEEFHLVVSDGNALAQQPSLDFDDLKQQKLLLRGYCENREQASELFRSRDIDVDHGHEVASEQDLMRLLAADFGISIMPESTATPEALKRMRVNGFDMTRTVRLYGVAGRQRTAVATAILKLLRSADWKQRLHHGQAAASEQSAARAS